MAVLLLSDSNRGKGVGETGVSPQWRQPANMLLAGVGTARVRGGVR